MAAILGTLQATLTDFRYLRKKWKYNTEEEALLGVSITGNMDCPLFTDVWGRESLLREMKEVVRSTNREWAKILGIKPAAAITCVKPSGTVSQLVESSSGIHPRFSDYYIRRVIGDSKDPLTTFMRQQGVPSTPSGDKFIFEFPIKSPKYSTCVEHVNAISQLDVARTFNTHWCDHNASCTIYYDDDDFLALGHEIYKDFDRIGGLSFFPKTDHVYENAPYEAIEWKQEYKDMVENFPKIDWSAFREEEDNTTATHELACSGGICEI